MKNLLLTCFLALVCLVGRYFTTSSKVADSPTEVPLHRSALPVSLHSGDTHRGGAILSDTFLKYPSGAEISNSPLYSSSLRSVSMSNPSDVDGGPNYQTAASPQKAPRSDGTQNRSLVLSEVEASVIGHPTPLPSSPARRGGVFGLPTSSIGQLTAVKPDNRAITQFPFSPFRGTGGPAGHPSSLPSQILIYGEIINPDSLGPLILDLKSELLPFGKSLSDTSIQIIPENGTFFDGVLDPRTQKFLIQIPMDSDLAILSLNLGKRSLLKDFLIGKGDSIKIGVDMQDNTLVFGGPDKNWFEAQYSLYRNQKSERFDAPRTLLEVDKEQFLNQSDHRSKILHQDSVFGSRIRVLEMGKDGEEKEFLAMLFDDPIQLPGLEVLDVWKEKLDPNRFQLLYQWNKASYLRDRMQSLRRYHYSMPLAMGDSVSASSVLETFPKLLTQLQVLIQKLDHPDCIPCLDLAAEWAFSDRIGTGISFEHSLQKLLSPTPADRVLLAKGLKGLNAAGLSFSEMEELENQFQSEEIRKIWNTLTADLKHNQPLTSADFTNLKQEKLSLSQIVDKPSLVYFYFSTCTHSGNYFKNYLKPFVDQYGLELGLQVIAISVDDDPELWHSQISEYSDPAWINLNLSGKEKSEWLEKYHVKAFPRTFVLDKNARVKSFAIGGSDFDSYSSRLLFLLRQEPESKPIPHTINPTNL